MKLLIQVRQYKVYYHDGTRLCYFKVTADNKRDAERAFIKEFRKVPILSIKRVMDF